MVENVFIIRTWLPQILSAVKEALFPAKCLSCGLFFHPATDRSGRPGRYLGDPSAPTGSKHEIFKWAMAPFVCPACSDHFSPVGSPLCSRCGLMFKSRAGDDHHCGECLDAPKRFRMARAFGVYDQTLMESIHRFKFKGKVQLARPLGALMLAALLIHWGDDPPDLAVPVPLHAGRFRERGFNQAFLLIRDWQRTAAQWPVPLPNIGIEREVLVRTRRTGPQTGLGRRARLQNIKNAFAVSDETRVFQKKILLVDDVYTTGATVDECAGALLKAGAERVDVLTLARTM
jgi:ComF family protein